MKKLFRDMGMAGLAFLLAFNLGLNNVCAATVYTTGSNVNFRESAAMDGRIIDRVPKGAALELLQISDGWAQVKYNGKTGYINTQFVSALGASSPAMPAAINTDNGAAAAAAASTQSPVPVSSRIICIDPGHQTKGSNTKEQNGPGSTVMKARVTGGTTGTTTGVPEYKLTLAIGLKLKAALEAKGYTVVMTRTINNVNISNMERAKIANDAGAAITVRLHANGASSSGTNGALALAPSKSNPYVASLSAESQRLSSNILNAYCAATGMKNIGVQLNDTMTGINWCKMPVSILEMGFMTNPSDDTNMQNEAYQAKMVQGIVNGIDAYFK